MRVLKAYKSTRPLTKTSATSAYHTVYSILKHVRQANV